MLLDILEFIEKILVFIWCVEWCLTAQPFKVTDP